ncbi:DUF2867 domain-containing protein [Microbacterium sp. 179-I 3D2 NHS]|uniref:DUF2867 domain-containing protein n=1 Tax=Microbacterium sp. 179-I 3D2 NHS TaxID=3235178 RepID=UPI0039A1DF2D
MRLPNCEHTSRPWRMHAVVPDFTLEDVWALPVHGSADDFSSLVELMTSGGDEDGDGEPLGFLDSAAARFLWRLRDLLGELLGIGRIAETADDAQRRPIPGDRSTSLRARLDEDLVGTAENVRFTEVPMRPLYLLDDEFAAEISNATMHGVMHLSWVAGGDGVYEGRMAVLVKPRGRLGRVYMAAIRPFRYAVVYPALLRHLERSWRPRAGGWR